MNIELIQNLYDTVIADNDTTEETLVQMVEATGDFNHDESQEVFALIYNCLYDKMILSAPTFQALTEKMLNQDNFSAVTINDLCQDDFVKFYDNKIIKEQIAELETISDEELLEWAKENHPVMIELNKLKDKLWL